MITLLLLLILLAILFPGLVRGLIIFVFVVFTLIPVLAVLVGDHDNKETTAISRSAR